MSKKKTLVKSQKKSADLPSKTENGPREGAIEESGTKEMLGTKDEKLVLGLMRQLLSSLPQNNNTPDEGVASYAMSALFGIKPKDELEGMLAVHMVATHAAAMDFLKRAVHADKQEVSNTATNCANKLLRTFTAQMETLNKYRGKGQQKVTVEHVHVYPGGQAIVGNVNRGEGEG